MTAGCTGRRTAALVLIFLLAAGVGSAGTVRYRTQGDMLPAAGLGGLGLACLGLLAVRRRTRFVQRPRIKL